MEAMNSWQEFVSRIVHWASHGYHWYARVDIPEKKVPEAERIDRKLIQKYPEIGLEKDARYRRKKAGKANYAYLRWERWGILLRSRGQKSAMDDEIWHEFYSVPYQFKVGGFLELKVGKAPRGKYTCFLTKQCYRNLKTLLRELFEDQRWDQLQKQWLALQYLPAWSGVLHQVQELYRTIKLWRVPRQYTLKNLRLKRIF